MQKIVTKKVVIKGKEYFLCDFKLFKYPKTGFIFSHVLRSSYLERFHKISTKKTMADPGSVLQ